jgi:hypothetical protein
MTINVFGGGSSGGPVFPLQRSVRLRSSNSAYFNRTLSVSSTSSTICTWSGWVKRGALGAARAVVAYSGNSAGNSNMLLIEFVSDTIRIGFDGPLTTQLQTTAVYRDPSAWYHIVVAYDSPQATASNRAKLYVNGVQVTAFTTSNYPAQNQAIAAASTNVQNIGTVSTLYFDGYIAEANFIDGQALTPASFGSINSTTGVWQPVKYTGTYGTNGFYLNFQDNSNNTAATIGKDSSGNGNNFTPNGISVTAGVTYDSMLDVPTLTGVDNANFAVLNPLDYFRSSPTNGNLNFVLNQGTGGSTIDSTIGISSGKWYWETVYSAFGGSAAAFTYTGMNLPGDAITPFYGVRENITHSTGVVTSSYGTVVANGSAYATGDVIQIAYDADAGKIWYGKNGTWSNSGVPSTGTNANVTGVTGRTLCPAVSSQIATAGWSATGSVNFGQRPFSYTPPTGFKSLNTFNLPDSTIPNGAEQFAATTYTGTGSAMTVTNTVNGKSFQPNFLWIKQRNNTANHVLADSIRGIDKYIFSNLTNADATATAGTGITAFNTNGFSLGTETSTVGSVNAAGGTGTYVGWQWKAGGAAVTNTSGSISSQVSANPSAGFSIVTYTANNTAGATVGHGLNVAPKFIITKNRDNGSTNWATYHESIGATNVLVLNGTGGQVATSTSWNNTAPSSTVFTVSSNPAGGGYDTNYSTQKYVAYCFSEIAGFSKFGSYTGNNSATDGTFVYLGFKPRFLIIKSTSAGTSWVMVDSSRNTYNLSDTSLYSESANSESTIGTVNDIDFLSNGFKLRNNTGFVNASQTYIYAAFAENPFKNALAR